MLDFIRIGCAVPPVRVGDVAQNVQDICRYMEQANAQKADLVLFPELAMTGYSCQDLFLQDKLWECVKDGLGQILRCSQSVPALTAVVGMPLRVGSRLYNTAAVISGGQVRGFVPKTFIPNYNEFYEKRWFSSAEDLQSETVSLDQFGLTGSAPLDANLLFQIGDGTLVGVEICEDLWTPLPPSTALALAGAEVVLNLSASNETIGKRSYRRNLVKQQSASCSCVYAYCSAGETESTQDLAFAGHSLIGENGILLAENKKQFETDYLLLADCDLGKIRNDRRKNRSFSDAGRVYGCAAGVETVNCGCQELRSDGTLYQLQKLPFVPQTKTGISYTLQGDYYLPDLALPPEETQPIGIWGQRHLRYIRQHKRLLYSNLLTSGKLNSYLADVDRQAEEMFSRLVKQMARQGSAVAQHI